MKRKRRTREKGVEGDRMGIYRKERGRKVKVEQKKDGEKKRQKTRNPKWEAGVGCMKDVKRRREEEEESDEGKRQK